MRIKIKGVTYDTAKAAMVSAYINNAAVVWTLFCTGRRYFIHRWDMRENVQSIEPVTANEAVDWLAARNRKLGIAAA